MIMILGASIAIGHRWINGNSTAFSHFQGLAFNAFLTKRNTHSPTKHTHILIVTQNE